MSDRRLDVDRTEWHEESRSGAAQSPATPGTHYGCPSTGALDARNLVGSLSIL
ncbi:hypothetical protein O4328_28810 [Rhodococcus opacus]|uniref:Uncharacterized protein n=1 Tax=Rhodococcus opacus TaxID=37919 RepID=A0AAX3YPG9_RHOOP|nr:hypothetical protein [Rhodococcus opacus]MCZ4587642.1 hypothetical protein [Rhodococcus opacus]WLF51362.1 hypothetical protein Q5707_37450 [Rhodococcus opacus]